MGKSLITRRAVYSVIAAALPLCVVGASANPLEAMKACRAIEDKQARLSCYDNLAASLAAVTATTATPMPAIAPSSQPSSTGPLTPTPEQIEAVRQQMRMGPLDLASLDSSVTVVKRKNDGLVNKIEVRVTRIESLANGRIRFVTADGQEWTQTENVSVRLPRSFPSDGIRAEIRSAALGSFFLKLDNNAKSIRVRPRR